MKAWGPIFTFETLPSTQSYLRDIVVRQGASAAGTVVWAKQQSEGRGRYGRQWASPVGGLYLSLAITPPFFRRFQEIPLVAGVALHAALVQMLGEHAPLSVKWPNDLLLEGKKVAGILCEFVDQGERGLVLVGVGINANLGAKELLGISHRLGVASLAQYCGNPIDLGELLQKILEELREVLSQYRQQGFNFIRYEWERRCAFLNREVGFQEAYGEACVPARKGIFKGLDEDGALLLEEKGRIHTFKSGEITCC